MSFLFWFVHEAEDNDCISPQPSFKTLLHSGMERAKAKLMTLRIVSSCYGFSLCLHEIFLLTIFSWRDTKQLYQLLHISKLLSLSPMKTMHTNQQWKSSSSIAQLVSAPRAFGPPVDELDAYPVAEPVCRWVTHEYWKIALLQYLKMCVKLWIIYRQVLIFNAHLNQFQIKNRLIFTQ